MALCCGEQVYFDFSLHSIFLCSPMAEAFDLGFKLEQLCALQRTSVFFSVFTLLGFLLDLGRPVGGDSSTLSVTLGKIHC